MKKEENAIPGSAQASVKFPKWLDYGVRPSGED
jgi:hypothetical protein